MSRTTAPARWQAGPAWHDHDLVTCTGLGTPMDPANVRQSRYGPRGRLELDDLHTHHLRHICASLMLAAGVSPRVVQECLGHAGIAVTLALYSHTTPALHAEATDRPGRLVSEADWQQNGSNEPTAATGES